MPSLREIEKSVTALWLNKEARDWLASDRKEPLPECLKGAPVEVLRTVDRNGVNLYGELMRFGLHDVMESIYPYCSRLLGKKWTAIVDDYRLKFPADHHNFNRLCKNLPQYFSLYGGNNLERYPFLPELADYEWVELEKMEEDVDVKPCEHVQLSTPEQIVGFSPVVNPTLSVRDYKYNILEIASYLESGRKLPKMKAERTLVAVYRVADSHRCKFVEVGEAAAKIVEIARQGTTYQALIPIVVALTPELAPQDSVAQFLELVEDLQDLGIFIGSAEIASPR